MKPRQPSTTPKKRPERPKAGPRARGGETWETDEPQRLQKVLSAAGVGSRRHCEEMILAGRVEVDGQTVTELGVKVDPSRQKIFVDGEPLRKQPPRKVYYLLNKPQGVLSTNYDQAGRTRVIDLLPEAPGHLFTVGRLDQSSEGLILVTNDGDLANRLTHPRYGVSKTYQVLVAGEFTPSQAAVLTRGVRLAEGWAKADHVKVRSQRGKSTLLEIVLSEGRNREIRRLLARVGHKVLKLKRVAIASLRLADLGVGEYRRLRSDEVAVLRKAASQGRNHHKPRRAAPAETGARAGSPKPAGRTRSGGPPRGKPAAGKKQRPPRKG